MESEIDFKDQSSDNSEKFEQMVNTESQLKSLFYEAIKSHNLTMIEYNDMVRTLQESKSLLEYLNKQRMPVTRIQPGSIDEKIYNLAKKYFELKSENNYVE